MNGSSWICWKKRHFVGPFGMIRTLSRAKTATAIALDANEIIAQI
jgi:hypothetical protein